MSFPPVSIIEAPRSIQDRLIDGLIEASETLPGLRWVLELDACRIEWRRRDGICPCGGEL